MKIAIHHSDFDGSFSNGWIRYCKDKKIPYKIVDAYSNNIVDVLADCDMFLWHFHHAIVSDQLFAKQLLISLQLSGKKVYPNIYSNWAFDDKLAQKYLFESLGIPHAKNHVFYTEESALSWIENGHFPLVMKLRGGATGTNVFLIEDFRSAKNKIFKAFHRGFSQFNLLNYYKNQKWRYKKREISLFKLLMSSFYRLFKKPAYSKYGRRERGYVLFQDFIPNNNCDYRIIVIGDKAYGMKRMVRENDFRASGSSVFVYSDINLELIQLAFSINDKLQYQSIAFDFIYDGDKPVVVEVSYCFGTHGSNKCPGYWDRALNFHEEKIEAESWIIENLIQEVIDER